MPYAIIIRKQSQHNIKKKKLKLLKNNNKRT